MAQPGRPSIFTPELAAEICRRIASGQSLRSVCRDEAMPDRSTVKAWVVNDIDGFSGQYARARELGLEELADETLEIADDSSLDTRKGADGQDLPDHEWMSRSKLRVDTRKWLLSKLMPKVYGDRLDVNATVRRGAGEMTDAELAAIASAGRAGASPPSEDED